MSRVIIPAFVAFSIIAGSSAAIGIVYFWETKRVVDVAAGEKRERARVVETFLRSKLSNASSVVQALAKEGKLSDQVGGSQGARERFLVKARSLAALNREIDQVRLISATGLELLRINQGGAVVPEGQLRDQSDAAYFNDGRTLASDEVLISEFSLNVENGEVERPFRPVVRLVAPLRDVRGELDGLVVLNLSLERWFGTLETALPRGGSEFELLNSAGHWERATEPSREWGNDLPERSGESLAKKMPELWAEIQSRPEGTFGVGGDHYVWLRVEFGQSPDSAGAAGARLITKGTYHVILSRIPEAHLSAELGPIRMLGGGSMVLAILAAFGVVVSLSRRERGRRLELEQLREREARRREQDEHRALLEKVERVAGTGSWRWDVVADEMVWSEGMVRIFGELEPGCAPRFADQAALFLPGDFEKLSALVRAAQEHGREFRISLQRAVAPGRSAWVDVQGFPVSGADGRVVEIDGFVRDISLEREADEQMRLLAAVAAKTNNLVVITDAEGRIEWVNDAFCRVSGYEFGEVSRRDFREVFHGPDTDHSAAQGAWGKSGSGGQYSGEVLHYTKDGRPYWVSLSIEPLRDESGAVSHYVAVQVDITEQKQIDESLQRHAAMLEAAGEIANIGGWEVDLETMTPVWSKETRRIHEVDDDFVLTLENALEFYPPDGRAVLTAAIERSLETGESHDCELPFLSARGRNVLMRVKWAVEQVEGRSVRLFGVIRDVTERRRMESELIEARDRAEAASAAKSQFVANMSHEIRTPLNAILGMCELIREEPNGPEACEYLETIRTSGNALLGLITDVLSFSQIEAGKVELHESGVDLRSLVGESLRLHYFSAREKDLHLDFKVAPELPTRVTTDARLVRQVLTNLVGNAIKFTPRGSVSVEIGLGRGLIGEEGIRFSVVDTGIGIAPEDHERVFRSFDQVDASDSRQFGGAGLGLAICQRLLKLLGGEICLNSVLGVGSEFLFEIPLKAAGKNSSKDERKEAGYSSVDSGLAERRPLDILIAEDSEINQRLTVAVLNKMGYAPRSVANGLEAFEEAVRKRYDVILMDLQMPVMDGIRATRKILADSRTGTPQIIAVTANAQDDERDRCLAVGMVEFLTKPLRSDGLAKALTQAHRRMFERIETS